MSNRFDYQGGAHDIWLAQHQEPILDPALPIIDAHHHLWIRSGAPYLLPEFAADLHSGHRVVATVFAECHAMYRTTGPETLRPVGEMVFVAGIGAQSDAGAFDTAGVCRAAVGNVDLTLAADVAPVLDALDSAADGRLRGVRASVCWDADPGLHRTVAEPGYLARADVRSGIRALAERGLVLDCWLYHPQLADLGAVAAANPDLVIVLNHCGTPILGGPYRSRQAEVRAEWRADMRLLARHPNIYCKLGALPARFPKAPMTDPTGTPPPPDSARVAEIWGPWILDCIETFGPSRCMFESNFPVHKNWLSYPVLWNAFKRITAGASATEKRDLFAATAARVYRIPLDNP